MKKKSLLLLLLTFVMSMVIGLVGCTSTGTTSGSESEPVSEEESVVKEVIDSTVTEAILLANESQTLLSSFSTYVVKYDFKEGELSGHKAEYFYDGSDEESDAIYAH